MVDCTFLLGAAFESEASDTHGNHEERQRGGEEEEAARHASAPDENSRFQGEGDDEGGDHTDVSDAADEFVFVGDER